MRTLTKEWVSHSGLFNDSGALSLDLIGDGPNEIVAKRLNSIHERTDLAELKKDFSKNFKVQLANMERIGKEEVSELISGLDKTAIKSLEKRVTSRCRIWAWFERTIWSALLLLILGSLFKFFGEGMFFAFIMICGLGLGVPIIGPSICLMGYADRDFFLTSSIGYMKDRKRLIRIYGREYMSNILPC